MICNWIDHCFDYTVAHSTHGLISPQVTRRCEAGAKTKGTCGSFGNAPRSDEVPPHVLATSKVLVQAAHKKLYGMLNLNDQEIYMSYH